MPRPSRRRTIEELVQKYRRTSQSGVDIYVEGRGDKNLLDWYMRSSGVTDVACYTIDSIEVPDAELILLELGTHSNRNRVIALANLLAERGVDAIRAKFVVDRDIEDLAPSGAILRPALVSDWGALPISLFSSAALGRMADVFFRGEVDYGSFADDMYAVAACIYAARAAANRLAIPLRILPVGTFLRVDGGRFVLNEDGYLDRLIVASAAMASREEFKDMYRTCRDAARVLPREVSANDHDLLSVVVSALKISGSFSNRSEIDVERMLWMCLTVEECDRQSVFRSATKDH